MLDSKFSIDYQPEHMWICFQWYCDTVRLIVYTYNLYCECIFSFLIFYYMGLMGK